MHFQGTQETLEAAGAQQGMKTGVWDSWEEDVFLTSPASYSRTHKTHLIKDSNDRGATYEKVKGG